jgi:hypothetical protein
MPSNLEEDAKSYLVERRKHICSAPGWLNLSMASCLNVPVIPAD